MSSSQSSWSAKLEKKLSVLNDNASRESIQTVAKWIGFNRKFAEVFAGSLVEAFRKASSTRQWMLMQVTHEVLLLEANTAKWERFHKLRNIMGEKVLLKVLHDKIVDVTLWMDKFQGLLVEQWKEKNVWEGSTLWSQIQIAATNVETKPSDAILTLPLEAVTATTTTASIFRPDDVVDDAQMTNQHPDEDDAKLPLPVDETEAGISEKVEQIDKETDPAETTIPETESAKQQSILSATSQGSKPTEDVVKEVIPPPTAQASSVKIESTNSATTEAIEYDFDSKGIPFDTVEAREFLEPCKAIATLQIARDLRNDGHAQLSSILSEIPENIREYCRQAKQHQQETGEPLEMDADTVRDFSKRLSDKFLDLDMAEQLQSIRTFRDIVEKQRIERQKLIHLLIKSRCQFGAKEAAEKFFQLDETAVKLQKRKELISDAMALEGLDSEEVPASKDDNKAKEKELQPLTWYEEVRDVGANKRAKTS